MALDSLTIDDLSDREFLLVVRDVATDDGWADSDAIKERLDLAERRIASTRLSWLARWGAVEREYETDEHDRPRVRKSGKFFYTQRWRLTEVGADLIYGALGKRQSEQLNKINDSQMLFLTQWLTERVRETDPTVIKLVSREWRYGSSPRRNGRLA